jgi:hypothetical protein
MTCMPTHPVPAPPAPAGAPVALSAVSAAPLAPATAAALPTVTGATGTEDLGLPLAGSHVSVPDVLGRPSPQLGVLPVLCTRSSRHSGRETKSHTQKTSYESIQGSRRLLPLKVSHLDLVDALPPSTPLALSGDAPSTGPVTGDAPPLNGLWETNPRAWVVWGGVPAAPSPQPPPLPPPLLPSTLSPPQFSLIFHPGWQRPNVQSRGQAKTKTTGRYLVWYERTQDGRVPRYQVPY